MNQLDTMCLKGEKCCTQLYCRCKICTLLQVNLCTYCGIKVLQLDKGPDLNFVCYLCGDDVWSHDVRRVMCGACFYADMWL